MGNKGKYYKCCESEFFSQIMAAIVLVVFGGVMSGLTMNLLSMSLVDLEVLSKSGSPKDHLRASKLFVVVKRQHLLLCTLLLFYTAAAEMVPVFLHKLVHESVAIPFSAVFIFVFAKIIPESVFSKYGLAVGAAMTPVIHLMIWITFPVAYPISKLLDSLLGNRHQPLFRRAELKTLVNFHSAQAGKVGELSQHETTIISGVLELTEKTAKDAMTPLSETFVVDINTKLNRYIVNKDMINLIMVKGHSRIPVYHERPNNIIGLILVKNLLTINPADELSIKNTIIRRIPRISDKDPLYDVLKEFQKGFSHMAAVVKDHSLRIASEQTPSKRSTNGSMREVKLDIHDACPQETKSRSLRNWKSLSRSPHVSSRINSRSRRWSSGSLYSDILELNQLSLSMLDADAEVIGIISMEDVVEELLKEEIYDKTDHHRNHW